MTRLVARRTILAIVAALAVCPPIVFARPSHPARQQPATKADQDTFTRAKALYASAEFESALQLLQTLKGPAASSEASAYQAYCLVALGRRTEAKQVVEKIVLADPLFRPAEGQVAPHMRLFFDETRKPLLPRAAREGFADAKAALDNQDMTLALGEFDRVIAVLAEIGTGEPDVADLRALAVAFRDIARAARPETGIPNANPTRGAALAAVAAAMSAEVPPSPVVYDAQSAGVVAPAPISTPWPEWRPAFFELNRTFSGDIQVLIGEDGKVVSALMISSVHPRYDGPLLDAAKSWTFKPAMKDGAPVRYRYVMTVRVLK